MPAGRFLRCLPNMGDQHGLNHAPAGKKREAEPDQYGLRSEKTEAWDRAVWNQIEPGLKCTGEAHPTAASNGEGTRTMWLLLLLSRKMTKMTMNHHVG